LYSQRHVSLSQDMETSFRKDMLSDAVMSSSAGHARRLEGYDEDGLTKAVKSQAQVPQ
jgi:hypothetical protein